MRLWQWGFRLGDAQARSLQPQWGSRLGDAQASAIGTRRGLGRPRRRTASAEELPTRRSTGAASAPGGPWQRSSTPGDAQVRPLQLTQPQQPAWSCQRSSRLGDAQARPWQWSSTPGDAQARPTQLSRPARPQQPARPWQRSSRLADAQAGLRNPRGLCDRRGFGRRDLGSVARHWAIHRRGLDRRGFGTHRRGLGPGATSAAERHTRRHTGAASTTGAAVAAELGIDSGGATLATGTALAAELPTGRRAAATGAALAGKLSTRRCPGAASATGTASAQKLPTRQKYRHGLGLGSPD